MNWTAASLTELYTIAAHEECAQEDKWKATHEIIRREKLRRKPYRNKQMKIRKAVAKW